MPSALAISSVVGQTPRSRIKFVTKRYTSIFLSSKFGILKNCGIIYARATKCDYTFNIPTNLYTFGGSCTISCQQFPKMIQKWLKLSPKSMKLFYIWGHSYELDLYHEHEKIYYQYEKLANKEDTWYATNKDVFSYILAFKKLKFYQKSNEFVNK